MSASITVVAIGLRKHADARAMGCVSDFTAIVAMLIGRAHSWQAARTLGTQLAQGLLLQVDKVIE